MVLADNGSGIPGFGDWAEQLIAESTGKNDKGILPVVVPSLDAPNFDPSTPDEVLVTIGAGRAHGAHSPPPGWGAAVDAPLGAQMLLWEYATVVAGRIIGINPFDQPDVESAKQAARDMLEGGGEHPLAGLHRGPGRGLRDRGAALRREAPSPTPCRRCSARSTTSAATSR